MASSRAGSGRALGPGASGAPHAVVAGEALIDIGLTLEHEQGILEYEDRQVRSL